MRWLYRNNLKNREFGKEGLQDLHSERGSIAERQGLSENADSEVIPTQPKPDSSICFGIFLFLIFIIPFQARIYKFLRPVSFSWMDPSWQLPVYFEPLADLYISDFILVILGVYALVYKKIESRIVLTLFLGVTLLSILLSGYGSYILSYWRWTHLVLPAFLAYYLRSWAVSLKTIATVVVVSASLECAVGATQYLVQHQIGFKIVGEPTIVDKNFTGPHFNMPKKAVTSVDYILTSSEESTKIYRATGTLPHPNVLGGFLVFSLMMTCFLYERSNKKGWVAAAFVLQIVTLFMTYSRAALFAFGGAIVLWLLFHYLSEKRISIAWKPLTLGLALSILLFFPQLFYRGGVITYNEVATKSDEMRISMQKVALLIIADNPWLGVGFNNYLIAFPKYTQGFSVEPIAVHNIYLLIAAETGLVGLACFLALCCWVVRRGWQQRASLEGRTLLALFLALLAIGCVDYYPIVLQQTRVIFFLTAGLLLSSYSSVVLDHLDKSAAATALSRG